jgi:methylenetetrahydrofolate--tRNA-(uracil-5-)-methyltransferase
MHRNTYINSPKLLSLTMQMKQHPNIMFAGQITGVEGYIESASSGLVSGINMSRIIKGLEPLVFPKTTAHGALCHYINDETNKNFQPMNVNFGILPELGIRIKSKVERYGKYAERALNDLDIFVKSM